MKQSKFYLNFYVFVHQEVGTFLITIKSFNNSSLGLLTILPSVLYLLVGCLRVATSSKNHFSEIGSKLITTSILQVSFNIIYIIFIFTSSSYLKAFQNVMKITENSEYIEEYRRLIQSSLASILDFAKEGLISSYFHLFILISS